MSDYKLVPVEPTEEMLEVLHSNVQIQVDTYERTADIINDKAWWAAVVAAAPQPPALGGELETLAWLVRYSRDGQYSAHRHNPTGWAHGYEVSELIDRAHLAPLQAEIDAYKASRDRLHEWLREEQLKNIHLTGKVKELLHEAYEAGYCDAQNNPNGIGDRAERDKAAERLMAEHIAALSKPAGSEQV